MIIIMIMQISPASISDSLSLDEIDKLAGCLVNQKDH